MSLYYWYL